MRSGLRLRPDPRAAARAGGGRLRVAILDHGPLLAVGAVVLVMVVLVSALAPSGAQAKGILGTGISIPNPLTLIGNGVGSLLGGLGGDIAKLAVGAFDAIIKALFAPIAKFITTQLIGWLITVPNFTQGNVAQLEQTVEAMGGRRSVRSRRSRSSATGWLGTGGRRLRVLGTGGLRAHRGCCAVYGRVAVAVRPPRCS